MAQSETLAVKSRAPLFGHEALDAYWYAETLRSRALQIVADAECSATIGHSLDAALGRVIRWIAEAANGGSERADARLARARAALGVVFVHVHNLSLKCRLRNAIIADLRERACLLLERFQMLQGTAVETWASSNRLPTVLDEVRSDVEGGPQVDVLAALELVPDAAARDLPGPVVEDDAVAPTPPDVGVPTSSPPVGLTSKWRLRRKRRDRRAAAGSARPPRKGPFNAS